jgi:two-component system OmpR family response regulator
MFRVMEHVPHILVVDDDREIRDLLARFLEEKHHMRVTSVRDAREARRAFANGHYHLVVLDLMLPGEGGLDFARWLRTQSDVPVVMLTAMGEETDRIIGLELVPMITFRNLSIPVSCLPGSGPFSVALAMAPITAPTPMAAA